MTEIVFNGPAGRIDARYKQSNNPKAPVVLILGPEPVDNENIDNLTIQRMYKTFFNAGFSVLRINYRGVGKSQGEFTAGEEELLDVTAALDWLHSKNMEASTFWVAGFSFGAWLGMQLVMRRPEIEGYLFVSTPTKKKEYNFLVPCTASGILIHGSMDEKSPEKNIYALIDKLSTKSESDVEYATVEGANHSFLSSLEELEEIMNEYISRRIIEDAGKVRKVKRDRRRRRKKKKNLAEEESIVQRVDPIKKIRFDW